MGPPVAKKFRPSRPTVVSTFSALTPKQPICRHVFRYVGYYSVTSANKKKNDKKIGTTPTKATSDETLKEAFYYFKLSDAEDNEFQAKIFDATTRYRFIDFVTKLPAFSFILFTNGLERRPINADYKSGVQTKEKDFELIIGQGTLFSQVKITFTVASMPKKMFADLQAAGYYENVKFLLFATSDPYVDQGAVWQEFTDGERKIDLRHSEPFPSEAVIVTNVLFTRDFKVNPRLYATTTVNSTVHKYTGTAPNIDVDGLQPLEFSSRLQKKLGNPDDPDVEDDDPAPQMVTESANSASDSMSNNNSKSAG